VFFSRHASSNKDHFALIDSDLGSPSSSYGERTERVKQLKRGVDQLREENANLENELAKEAEKHDFEMEQLEKEK
jgi:uncharacterized phage infection (PIP) family protein YhgE